MSGTAAASSQSSVRTALRPVFALTLLGTLAWLGAILLAPVLRSRSSGAAPFLYAVFSPICHQIPGRSFFISGFPMAVCGRCFGIYAGFLAGVLLYPFVRGFRRLALPSARLFVLASLPAGLDVLLGLSGVWQSPIGVRFATGLVWGSLLPFYFITGVAELVLGLTGRKAVRPPVPEDRTANEDLLIPGHKP
jgi:uncharacterized membrane protein